MLQLLLLIIINQSFESGIFHDFLKIARVIALHNGDDLKPTGEF